MAELARAPGFRSVLRNPEYLKLWVGQLISYVGDRFTQMALLGLVVGTAQTSHLMSRITFFSLLPFLLLGHLAGGVADRFSRRRVMVATDLLRGGLVLLLPLCVGRGVGSQPLLYLLVFLVGTCTAFFSPAKLSLIPNLVQRAELQAANALASGTGTIATLVGTYLAGVVVERVGSSTSFLIDGGSYLLSGLAIWMIRVPERRNPAVGAARPWRRLTEDFASAWGYLRAHRYARRLIVLSVALSFLSSFFYITLMTLGVDHFHLKTAGVGLLLAFLGLGMVLGAFLAPACARWARASHVLASAFVVVGLSSAAFAAVSRPAAASAILVVLGMANQVILVTLDTFLQRATPDRFRGKVFGFRGALTNGMFLIALLLVDVLLALTPALTVLRGLALFSVLVAAAILIVGEQFAFLIFRTIVRLILRVFFRVQVEGEQYLGRRGPLLIAGTHTGFLDAPLVISGVRRPVRFLVSEKVFGWPGVGLLVRLVGAIRVTPSKGPAAFVQALEHLTRGEAIGIFPEGKLSKDGSVGRFHRGIGRLQRESRCPIVPFAIHGGFEAWPWNSKLPRLRKVIIQFGVPIEWKDRSEEAITAEVEQTVRFLKASLDRRERRQADAIFAASVLELLETKADRFGARPALCMKQGRKWAALSYAELSRRARGLAASLIGAGLQPGERIAILCESRPEWAVCFFASVRAGAILVPLDVKLSETELASILADAAPRLLFVSSHYRDMGQRLKDRVPALEHVLLVDEEPGAPTASAQPPTAEAIPLSRARRMEETALIIYTSGTTGSPKGVMISFANLIFQVQSFERMVEITPQDRFLSILPLNHLLELTGGLLGVLHTGGMVCYASSVHPQEIAKAMRERRITAVIGVPLFYKTLQSSIEKEIRRGAALARSWFRLAAHLAPGVPPRLRRLFAFPLHRVFGGRLRALVSGGAPLDPAVARFFDRLGLPVLQGYGLTETSPVISVNALAANRIGSVGKPLPGIEVQIDAKEAGGGEGEVLTRGPHVMQGYYRRDDLTDTVIDREGWLHTGDLGRFDDDGFLYITGRIKNLIVLGGGKKVHPEEVEASLGRSPQFKEVCVLGRLSTNGAAKGTEEVCAVIVPSEALKLKWQDQPEALARAIKDELDQLGKDLAPYKRPSRIVVHLEELPKTATRKVRRPLVQQWLEVQIASGGIGGSTGGGV